MRTIAAALAGLALAATAEIATAQDAKNQGYLLDTYGGDIVTSSTTGLCVRTSDWTPARAVAQCDPELVKKPAPTPKPAVKPAPPPPKPEVKPQPKPKAAPDKLLPQKINFSADALFDFNKAVLKNEAKSMLDDLVRTLQGATYDVILAIGHTDRIGSVAYNQKLSERRAKAVKDYLISKGIADNRVHTAGKGKSQPLTKPADCKGMTGKKLIACYQPDRRVDVEVTGTK
jgi:OOP family OmpA-OmpF porin